MSLRRRKGSPYWHYDFAVQGRRFRGSTETSSRDDAAIIEAQLRRDALLGKILDRKPRITLDQAFGRYWLEHAYRLPGAKTIEYQLANLKALPTSAWLDDLGDNDVAKYVARRRAKVSDSTVNRELTILRAVVRMAGARWGVEVSAINWKAHWLHEPDPREDGYVTAEQALRLIDCAAPYLRDPIRFSLLTGVRLANCLKLNWSQVRMHDRLIVFRVKSRRPGGKRHVVEMSEAVFVLLANLGPQDHGPVFLRRGRPIKSWRTAWEGARQRAGLEHVRWHDLRHSFASWLVQDGVPIPVVRQLLGHQDIKTTLRYAHWAPEAKREAVELAASRLSRNAALADALSIGKKRQK